MGGSGGGGDQTVYQKSEPWSGAQPLAQHVMQGASGLTDYWNQIGAASPYQGERVAMFSPDQLYAQQAIRGYATSPDLWKTGLDMAQRQMQSQKPEDIWNQAISPSWNQVVAPTLAGQYMFAESNPYLQSNINYATRPIYDQLNQQTLPGLDTTANQAGRYGSGAWAQQRSNAIGGANRQAADTGAQMAGANYEAERARQMQALNFPMQMYNMENQLRMQASPIAQQWNNQLFKNLGYLTASGEEQQGLYQQMLGANRQAYDELVNNPYNLLANLGNLAFSGGALGGQSSSTQPTYNPSLGSQLLGMGGMGLGMYNSMQGIDWSSMFGGG